MVLEKISDSDLTKACSLAADKIPPADIKKLISTYSVDSVQKVPEHSRREFLNLLDKMIAGG